MQRKHKLIHSETHTRFFVLTTRILDFCKSSNEYRAGKKGHQFIEN